MGDLSKFGLRHRTTVVHGRMKARIREQAEWMDTRDDEGVADVVERAREMMTLAQQFKTISVIKARVVYRTSWADVAELLKTDEDTVRRVYEQAEKRWRAGDLEPWLPRPEEPARPLLRKILGGRWSS